MEAYTKTIWENDETQLNEDNMNKIEDQLETITDEIIDLEEEGLGSPAYILEINNASTEMDSNATKTIISNWIKDLLAGKSSDFYIYTATLYDNNKTYFKLVRLQHSEYGWNYVFQFESFQVNGLTLRISFSVMVDANNNITNMGYGTQNDRYLAYEIKSYPNTYGGAYYTRETLAVDNTTPFTPQDDYNPATKKYVDDAISLAIGSALGGSY